MQDAEHTNAQARVKELNETLNDAKDAGTCFGGDKKQPPLDATGDGSDTNTIVNEGKADALIDAKSQEQDHGQVIYYVWFAFRFRDAGNDCVCSTTLREKAGFEPY